MKDTRTEIVQLGDALIRKRGYNAFSFSDIAKQLGIKTASVHYHFPTKTSLGIAVITENRAWVHQLMQRTATDTPLTRLHSFLDIYSKAIGQHKICVVGSLATDFHTCDPEIRTALQVLADDILAWVIDILDQGKRSGIFHFDGSTRTRALMVITHMVAVVQLVRLTEMDDFRKVREQLIHDLTQ